MSDRDRPPSAVTERSFWWALDSLWSDGGSNRCNLRILDTVLFHSSRGKNAPVRWLFTSKSGSVAKKKDENITFDKIQERFTRFALANPYNIEGNVSWLMAKNGSRQLMDKARFLDNVSIAAGVRTRLGGAEIAAALLILLCRVDASKLSVRSCATTSMHQRFSFCTRRSRCASLCRTIWNCLAMVLTCALEQPIFPNFSTRQIYWKWKSSYVGIRFLQDTFSCSTRMLVCGPPSGTASLGACQNDSAG
jgi:hypothetical protein